MVDAIKSNMSNSAYNATTGGEASSFQSRLNEWSGPNLFFSSLDLLWSTNKIFLSQRYISPCVPRPTFYSVIHCDFRDVLCFIDVLNRIEKLRNKVGFEYLFYIVLNCLKKKRKNMKKK